MKFQKRSKIELEDMFLSIMREASKVQTGKYVSGRLFNTYAEKLFGTKLLSTINKRFGEKGKENGFTILRKKYNYPFLRNKYSRKDVLACYHNVFQQLQKQPTEDDIENWGGPKMSVVYRVFGTHLKAVQAMFDHYRIDMKVVRPNNVPVKRTEKVGYDLNQDGLGLMKSPVNEQGVVFLFAKLHERMGFPMIENIQQQFPDARAISIIEGSTRRVGIEFKYQCAQAFSPKVHSKSEHLQRYHEHCNYLVCWENNSPTITEELRRVGVKVLALQDYL